MPFCSLLDSHICVTLPGKFRPCCQADGAVVALENISYKEYVNSPVFQQVKDDMKDGWSTVCEKCRIDETNNIKSLRQHSNNEFTKSGIQYIEISLSNFCNLSCKSCNNTSSSKWEDLLKNNKELAPFFYQPPASKISLNKIFENVDLSNLKSIKYLGGEPFITPQTKELFNFLQEQNLIKGIELLINTNCTLYPEKWIDQLLQFKNVNIGLSIDGFEDSCDYARTGSNWKDLKQNIEKWVNLRNQYPTKIYLYFATTISALSVHDYHRLVDYGKSIKVRCNPYIIQAPAHLKLAALPDSYKRLINNTHINKWLTTLDAKFDPKLFEKMKTFIKVTDSAQGLNIKDHIPELAKYLVQEFKQ